MSPILKSYDWKMELDIALWLANKLVFSFGALMRCIKLHSNLVIVSKDIVSTDINDNRQTETGIKIVFSHSKSFKTWDFYEIWQVDMHESTLCFCPLTPWLTTQRGILTFLYSTKTRHPANMVCPFSLVYTLNMS